MRKLTTIILVLFFTGILISCKDSKKNEAIEENTELSTTDNSEEMDSKEQISEETKSDELTNEMTEASDSLPSADQYLYVLDGENADVQVRVGDVDNLGFGFEEGFDPFCGKNTKVHRYPWDVDSTDHRGTDRIMVVSGYKQARSDGYTSYTRRAHTEPVDIEMKYDPPTMEIEKIVLQMMLDDFQSPVWRSSFQFHINDKRLTYVEPIINGLNQTGPTGKLVQVGILQEDFSLFKTGEISIGIDDPVNDAGDGFAIDFIQLLINPKQEYICYGTITGLVTDKKKNPLADVLVSANGLEETLTGEDGTFELSQVPVGMISVIANKQGYQPDSESFELLREETRRVTLVLEPKEAENENFLEEEIKEKGFVNLYGILFDSGKDIPKKESEAVLNELANFLKNNPNIKIEIIGHTDSDGEESYNEDLSGRRAQSVVQWLSDHDIDVSNLVSDGKGESNPVASNDTDSGKALNRRVEVRVVD
ncbi:MAG: OmpA family protein [Flavobacteriaceae bacterium]|nr:OmpA family protein [Flavobacteriaceae bacterium]